jgi:hypothetical protein
VVLTSGVEDPRAQTQAQRNRHLLDTLRLKRKILLAVVHVVTLIEACPCYPVVIVFMYAKELTISCNVGRKKEKSVGNALAVMMYSLLSFIVNNCMNLGSVALYTIL